MDSSTQQIYMNYQKMIQSAEELEETAARMETLIDQRLSYYGQNANYWKGDAGDACRKKAKKLEANISKQIKDLRKAADAIRTAAKRERDTELRIMALFNR